MMDANTTYYAAMVFGEAPNSRDGKGEYNGRYDGGQDDVNSRRTAALQEVSSTTYLAPSQQSRPTATLASSPLTRASAFASMTSLGPPRPRPFSGSSNPSSLARSHPVYQTITTTATATATAIATTTTTATATTAAATATATNDGLLSANAPFPVTTTTIAQRNQTQSSSHLARHALAFAQIASSANFQTQPTQLRANASMTSPTTAASTHLDFRKPTTGDRTITTTTTIAPSSASPSHSRPPLSSPLSHPFNHAAPHHHSSILLSPPPLAPPQGALSSIMASSSALSATNGNGPSSASPLQPPKADFPRPMHEKSSGSFYDPLTDTTKERRPSDNWQKQVSLTRTRQTC
ncbi:hypothetical protein EV127DRAFT_88826 [Xylaria flabelliformis]|nr:hypothetical protein EV127DRAFT_88826 [Xylaria flabelliformis]